MSSADLATRTRPSPKRGYRAPSTPLRSRPVGRLELVSHAANPGGSQTGSRCSESIGGTQSPRVDCARALADVPHQGAAQCGVFCVDESELR